MAPGQWKVEIKVVHSFVVIADDEIQAELEAAKQLSKKNRAAASDLRIVDGYYPDGHPYPKDHTDKWYGIDKKFWEDI